MRGKLITLVMIVTISLILTGLTGFTNVKEKEITSLMLERTDIIQNVLLNRITAEEGSRQLRKIEMGKLYKDDCNTFVAYKNSDYDVVKNMKVISLKKESKVSDMETYLAEIEWTTSTQEGISKVNLTHYIGIKDCGESFKLVTFVPAEDINLLQ